MNNLLRTVLHEPIREAERKAMFGDDYYKWEKIIKDVALRDFKNYVIQNPHDYNLLTISQIVKAESMEEIKQILLDEKQ